MMREFCLFRCAFEKLDMNNCFIFIYQCINQKGCRRFCFLLSISHHVGVIIVYKRLDIEKLQKSFLIKLSVCCLFVFHTKKFQHGKHMCCIRIYYIKDISCLCIYSFRTHTLAWFTSLSNTRTHAT